MKKQWRVGWKPIDKATAKPQWSGVIFDSFLEADHVAKSLNSSDPENHYFPDLLPGPMDRCDECFAVVEKDSLKSSPEPGSNSRLCQGCFEHVQAVITVNS